MGPAIAETACAALLHYLDAMLDRNRQLNLTAVRKPEEAEILHVLDSLALALVDVNPQRCLEIGSGNGFPGVAAALLWPGSRVTLIERTQKKARAIEDLLAHSNIANAQVLQADAEQAPHLDPSLMKSFDLVLARALGTPQKVERLSSPMLASNGILVLWASASISPAEVLQDMELTDCIDYRLPEPTARDRRLLIYQKP